LEEEVGAGVSINPVAFIVVQGENVKLLPVNHTSAIDKLLDYVPDLFEKVGNFINKETEEDEKNKIQTTMKTKPKRNNIKTNISYEFDYNEQKPNTHTDENTFE